MVSDFVLGRMSGRMSTTGYEDFLLLSMHSTCILLADTGTAHGPPSRDWQVGIDGYRLLQSIWSSDCEFPVCIALTGLTRFFGRRW